MEKYIHTLPFITPMHVLYPLNPLNICYSITWFLISIGKCILSYDLYPPTHRLTVKNGPIPHNSYRGYPDSLLYAGNIYNHLMVRVHLNINNVIKSWPKIKINFKKTFHAFSFQVNPNFLIWLIRNEIALWFKKEYCVFNVSFACA